MQFAGCKKWVGALMVVCLTSCTTGDPQKPSDSSNKIILNSYEACVILGGPVMESWPQQCALDGKHFTQDISTGKKGDRKTLLFEIGPKKVDCMGVGPMQCLVVNGGYFYDGIEGYEHTPGQSVIIEVEREQYCDPDIFNDCPQDAGIYRYRFIREMIR